MDVKPFVMFFMAFASQLISVCAYLIPNEDCVYERLNFKTEKLLNKNGQLPYRRPVAKKQTERECEIECRKDHECIMWQWQPNHKHCWIMFLDIISDTNSHFGIKNCKKGKPTENASVCEVMKGDRKNYHIEDDAKTIASCKANCDLDADCLMWQFLVAQEECIFHAYEVDINKEAHVGIHYCLPRRCGVPNSNKNPGELSRIIEGGITTPNQYPWQVYLESYNPVKKTLGMCGGTLISDQSILTAAHCVKGRTNIRVKIGVHDRINDKLDFIKILEKDVHVPIEFEFGLKKTNDIAVLHLREKVWFSQKTKAPICLPSYENYMDGENYEDITVRVLGWGRTSDLPSGAPSNMLKHTDLKTLKRDDCNIKYYKEAFTDVRRMKPFCDQICALGENTGTGKGDSGGPLMWKRGGDQFYQIGVASHEVRKSENAQGENINKATVFTRTLNHLFFIKKCMEGVTWPEKDDI